jgi:hypothetical protein
MFPSLSSEHEDKSSQLYEWIDALAKLVARVIVHVPVEEMGPKLIDPITRHEHRDVLQCTDELADQITRRHVYDAPELSDRALEALDHPVTRMLSQRDFSPKSYRPGRFATGISTPCCGPSC